MDPLGDPAGSNGADAAALGGGDPHAGPVFADYIRAQLIEERARKESLEQRGSGVIATAGTLSTFLFGLAAFSKSPSTNFTLSPIDAVALVVALLLMLTAAILGLMTNRILEYGEPDPKYLATLTQDDADHWAWPDITGAQRLIAEADVRPLTQARGLNDKKATELQWAFRLEISAIASLAVAVSLIVLNK